MPGMVVEAGRWTEQSIINLSSPGAELGVRCCWAGGSDPPRAVEQGTEAVPTPPPLLLSLFAEADGRRGGYGPPPPHRACASHYPRCLDNRHCLCPEEAEEKEDFLHQPTED